MYASIRNRLNNWFLALKTKSHSQWPSAKPCANQTKGCWKYHWIGIDTDSSEDTFGNHTCCAFAHPTPFNWIAQWPETQRKTLKKTTLPKLLRKVSARENRPERVNGPPSWISCVTHVCRKSVESSLFFSAHSHCWHAFPFCLTAHTTNVWFLDNTTISSTPTNPTPIGWVRLELT